MARRPRHKLVALDDHRQPHAPLADDAARRPPRDRLEGLQQAQRRVQHVGAQLQTAIDGLRDVRFVLQRMRALALLAADESLLPAHRKSLQTQLGQLCGEAHRLSVGTAFDGQPLLDGGLAGGMTLQVGADAVDFFIAPMTPSALGVSDLSVRTTPEAQRAVPIAEAAIEAVSAQLAALAAALQGLDVLVANLRVATENVFAVKGRLTDFDMAQAVTTLLKAQILRQPDMALKAQAGALKGVLLHFPDRSPRA